MWGQIRKVDALRAQAQVAEELKAGSLTGNPGEARGEAGLRVDATDRKTWDRIGGRLKVLSRKIDDVYGWKWHIDMKALVQGQAEDVGNPSGPSFELRDLRENESMVQWSESGMWNLVKRKASRTEGGGCR